MYTNCKISRNKSCDNFATKTWYFCWSTRIMGFKTVPLNRLSIVIRLLLLVVIEVLFGIWGSLKFVFGDYITSHPFSWRFQEEKKWLNLRNNFFLKPPKYPTQFEMYCTECKYVAWVSCWWDIECKYVFLSLLLQATAAVFIYFSGVVTWAEVCICAWDIVAVINSLIAGFWTSASRSTECRWVNYGTI